MSDYPEIDEASLNAMIREFEKQESFDQTPIPSPPYEEPRDFPELNVIPLDEPHESPDLAPLPRFPQENKGFDDMGEEVQDLALMENVFDKRVTEGDIRRQYEAEMSRNDSGKLLTKDDVEVKTELNDMEILTISKIRFIADRYEVPALRDFSNDLMTLKISRMRKGRTEFIQGLHADERRENPQPSFLSRFFGMGGGQQ